MLESIANLGGKGLGLIKLSELASKYSYEVPDFFIIPSDNSKSEIEILEKAQGLKGIGNYSVRSSSPYEDSQNHSFAGIFETHLRVPISQLIEAVDSVKRSATSEKAREYTRVRGLTLEDRMAVIIQRMVEPDLAGVIYSTLSDFPLALSIEFCNGDGRGIVERRHRQFEIHDFYKKKLKSIFVSETGIEDTVVESIRSFRTGFENQGWNMEEVAMMSQKLEKEFGFPLDLEFAWTYQNRRGILHLLQARALTDVQPLQKITLPEVSKKSVLVRSQVVRGIGEYEGPVVVYPYRYSSAMGSSLAERDLRQIDSKFSTGYVLFIPHLHNTLIDLDSFTPNKKAIVEYGFAARSCHALTVCREKGILYMGDIGRKGERHYQEIGFAKAQAELLAKIKTGDIVRIVSDGRRALAYKV